MDVEELKGKMIELIVVLLVCGFLVYMVNQYLPIDPPFKTAINFVVVLCLVLYVLSAFGVVSPRLPQLR